MRLSFTSRAGSFTGSRGNVVFQKQGEERPRYLAASRHGGYSTHPINEVPMDGNEAARLVSDLMASAGNVNKLVLKDLPDAMRAAYDQFLYAPALVAFVTIRAPWTPVAPLRLGRRRSWGCRPR